MGRSVQKKQPSVSGKYPWSSHFTKVTTGNVGAQGKGKPISPGRGAYNTVRRESRTLKVSASQARNRNAHRLGNSRTILAPAQGLTVAWGETVDAK